VRHFSFDSGKSALVATLGPRRFSHGGLHRFLDLSAGHCRPDQTACPSSIWYDAADYLSLTLPLGGGAVCLQVDRSQLPVHNAGIVACKGRRRNSASVSPRIATVASSAPARAAPPKGSRAT
jgi:hypothetical protein